MALQHVLPSRGAAQAHGLLRHHLVRPGGGVGSFWGGVRVDFGGFESF